jgi:hypothetical protein
MISPDAILATRIKALRRRGDGASIGGIPDQQTVALRREFTQLAIAAAIDSIVRLASLQPSERQPEESRRLVSDLVAVRFPKAASAAVSFTIESLARLPAAEIAGILPDAASIERWRKAAKVIRPELADYFLRSSQAAAGTAGIDWLLAFNPPGTLSHVLAFILDQLAQGPSARVEAGRVQRYLGKDPKGIRLAALLIATESQSRRLNALAEAVRASNETLVKIADSVSRLSHARAPAFPLGAFVQEIFSNIEETEGKARTKICGALARLGGGLLLLDNKSPAGEDALRAVEGIGVRLRNLTRESDLAHCTWVLNPIDQPVAGDAQMLTLEGARRWAFAYEETERSGLPLAPLETLGFNLGIRPIVEVGERFEFQPQKHEDADGGMLPGDTAIALTRGWLFDGLPLIRARVRHPQNP